RAGRPAACTGRESTEVWRVRNRLRAVGWNLRSCARKGHVTYAATEPEYRAKLHASTPLGDGWSCLRCGNYVRGPPHGEGPARNAQVSLRRKELRSAFILRLLAC